MRDCSSSAVQLGTQSQYQNAELSFHPLAWAMFMHVSVTRPSDPCSSAAYSWPSSLYQHSPADFCCLGACYNSTRAPAKLQCSRLIAVEFCMPSCWVTDSGVVCRLYSSAFFNDTFPQHTPPEIVNSPLEGVVLTMKAIGIDKVQTLRIPIRALYFC